MDKQFDAKVIAFLEKNKEQMFADVDRLLHIDSVTGEPQDGAPFGRNISDAIDAMLAICASHGFATRNIDGMVGEAVWGQGEESLGIIGHMDIVPTGDGWTKPPLALTVADGMLYGRGVMDDKGPTVAAFYAFLAALDAGAVLNKKIMFLVGGDEETGMRCMKRYLETEKAPDMAFVPDGSFPAINCEKTLVHGMLSAALAAGSALLDIRGGTRTNVVPGTASAQVSSIRADVTLPQGITAAENDGVFTVSAVGTAAHASMPEKGDNAIVKLLDALCTLLPEGDPAIPALAGLHACCKATDGSGLGVACADEDSGPLTFNLGVVRISGATVYAAFDIRHPVSIDSDENLQVRLPEAAARAGWEASGIAASQGFCLAKDHVLVKTLMGIYNEINDSHEEPLAIGGGTYSRHFPCAVAYGMLFATDPETAHMADERIGVESFMKAARIYAHAIAQLGK